jgi:DNA polymerase III epsilon subunit family exonuclease
MFDLTTARFAFLDLETTGLSPWFGDRVCEIGIVLTEGKRIKQTYQQLVNPERPLSPAAASTNHISEAELVQAPTFSQVVEDVKTLLGDTIVVCHNAQFDLNFLDSEFHRAGHELQVPNMIDTLYMARQHYKLPSNTLASLAEAFNIQNPDAHRALADALTDKNLFFAMLDSLKSINVDFNSFIGIYNSPTAPREAIQLPTRLAEALKSGKRLFIAYTDKSGEQTRRWIQPIEVIQLQDYIYLRAMCQLREEERTFRLDRITSIKVED